MINLEFEGCVSCGNETHTIDITGLEWCADCSQRGDLLNWGYKHHWPGLDGGHYAIASGVQGWIMAATFGNDDMIWLMLATIDEQKNEAVA